MKINFINEVNWINLVEWDPRHLGIHSFAKIYNRCIQNNTVNFEYIISYEETIQSFVYRSASILWLYYASSEQDARHLNTQIIEI